MMKQEVIKVSDLMKTSKGFVRPQTNPLDTAAILRGDKTAFIIDGSTHINKGDFIVFEPVKGPLATKDIFSELNNYVFEATFVSPVPFSSPVQQLVCIRRLDEYTFQEGDFSSPIKYDSIIKDIKE